MDALSACLKRLEALAGSLGASPEPSQLEQLRADCASALATVPAGATTAAQQRQLWQAAARLWVRVARRRSNRHPLCSTPAAL